MKFEYEECFLNFEGFILVLKSECNYQDTHLGEKTYVLA